MVRRCAAAVGLLALWLSASVGSAQIGPGFAVSLEVMAGDADVIVHGTVARVAREDRPSSYQLDVTVKVADTVKGSLQDSIEFTVTDRGPSQLDAQQKYFTEWMTAGRPFLWFFRTNERFAAGATAPDARHPLTIRNEIGRWTHSLIPLGLVVPVSPYGLDFPTGYLTTDLQVLRRPEDILGAVRAEVVRSAQRPRAGKQNVGIPWDVMDLVGRAQDGYLQNLVVPVDERTEALCRRMIGSPESIPVVRASGRATPGAFIRESGVRCLRAFRSTENIALLSSLLNDRDVVTYSDPQGVQRRVYHVRKGAFEALQSWGVAVATPQLEADR